MAQSAGARSGQALHQQDFADMVSLVALAHTHTKLTLTTLRDGLDKLYPGQFLPPREKGNFVVEGPVPEFQFAIQCTIPGAAGFFQLNNVPRPYTEFSDFARAIDDAALRDLAERQLCWLSIDLLQAYGSKGDAYRFIGRALAQFAPQDAAVIVQPSTNAARRLDEDVRRRLAAGEQVF